MTRKLIAVAALAMLLVAPAGVLADNFLRVPLQPLPSQIGWVANEFIVAFNNSSANQLVVTSTGPGPKVNVASVQDHLDKFGVTRFRRQFPSERATAKSVTRPGLAAYYKVKLPSGANLDAAMAAFAADPNVDHVEKIGIHSVYATPNDTYYQNSPNPSFPYDQWHYWDTSGIHADSAWDTETGNSSVVVGILDTGTRYFHIDIGGNSPPWGPDNPFAGGNVFINNAEIPANGIDDDSNGFVDDVIGWDFVSSAGGFGVSCIDQDCSGTDNDPDDGDGHGTHVSGTVAAISNNGVLVAGIAGGFSNGTASGTGNGVKILPLRIGYHARYQGIKGGIVRMDWAAEAMTYVADLVDAGVDVAAINCSWGSSNSGGIDAAVNNLLAHDVMIVHAAGNDNANSPDYLGSKAGVMNVAATNRNGAGASFTNYGSWVDVAAPGVGILSTYRNPDDTDITANYIAVLDGTSMSTPHICGIAALLESCSPSLTGPEKFALIVNNTDPYTDTRDLGSGIANANKALAAAGCTSAACLATTPTTDFSASPVSGDFPLTVNFSDLSTNTPDTWLWHFGDGDSSTSENPSHQYTTPGTYTVTLSAGNCAGTDMQTKTDYIAATIPCECPHQADYDANGIVDAIDLNGCIDVIFFSAQDPIDPTCPATRFDFDCSGTVDAVDLNDLIDYEFFSGAAPCDPCQCTTYPSSCPPFP